MQILINLWQRWENWEADVKISASQKTYVTYSVQSSAIRRFFRIRLSVKVTSA